MLMSAVPRSMPERTSRCNDARWPRPIIRVSPHPAHRGQPTTISWNGSVRCKKEGSGYGESTGRNCPKNNGYCLSTLHNYSLKIIGPLQELALAGREPGRLSAPLALGAVPIAAGVIADPPVPTLSTLVFVATQHLRGALPHSLEHPPLGCRRHRA